MKFWKRVREWWGKDEGMISFPPQAIRKRVMLKTAPKMTERVVTKEVNLDYKVIQDSIVKADPDGHDEYTYRAIDGSLKYWYRGDAQGRVPVRCVHHDLSSGLFHPPVCGWKSQRVPIALDATERFHAKPCPHCGKKVEMKTESGWIGVLG